MVSLEERAHFVDNRAEGPGGAISLDRVHLLYQKSALVVTGSAWFEGKKADFVGGAIHAYVGSMVFMNGSMAFTVNWGQSGGGAIWLGSNVSCHISGARFEANAAGYFSESYDSTDVSGGHNLRVLFVVDESVVHPVGSCKG